MPRRYSAGLGAVHYKRVIPCMDVDDGRVVKGTRFIRDARDPVELAAHYDAEGADELIFIDITATSDSGRRWWSWPGGWRRRPPPIGYARG